METCFLGLGSNVSDRIGSVARALACIGWQQDMVLRRRSRMYVSPAWGHEDQEDFVNAVCQVETHLSPQELLIRLKQMEAGLGRQKRFKWGPREIDLDILFYGDRVVTQEDLTIPHPHVCERAFVLAPLAEIAPGLVHPLTGLKVTEHLENLRRSGDCRCHNLDI